MPILMGMLALPDAEVAEALVDKFRGLGRYYRELAERQREGRGARPVPRRVRGARHRRPARRPAGHARRRRPAAHDHARRRPGSTSTAGRPGCARRSSPTYAPGWRPTATSCATRCCPHARPDEQCGLSWLPDGDAAYAATLRYYTTTTKTAQEIHDIGLAQIEKLADEYRTLGPEVVGTDDLTADLRGHAHRPRSCTSARARSSSRPPRSRCSGRGTRCRSGSRCCRRRRAGCRRR